MRNLNSRSVLFILMIFILSSCAQIQDAEIEKAKAITASVSSSEIVEVMQATKVNESGKPLATLASSTPTRRHQNQITIDQDPTTPAPTATITPYAGLTWTPRPTMSKEEAIKLMWELRETNGSCQWPCWWGITPGVTTWREAESFLATFATKIYPSEYNSDNYHVFVGYSPIPKTYVFFSVVDGIVDLIEPGIYVSLDKLLKEYGKPDFIRIYGISHATLGNPRFQLAIYYSRGIFAAFEGATYKSKDLKICPRNIHHPDDRLVLWSPTRYRSMFEIGTQVSNFWRFKDEYESKYPQLEEVADINLDEFYQIYRDPKNIDTCFTIPDPTWPDE